MDTGDSGHSRGWQRRRKHGRKGRTAGGAGGDLQDRPRRPAQSREAVSVRGYPGDRMWAKPSGTWHSRGLINSDENRASRPWGRSGFRGSEGAARGVCKQKAGTSQPTRALGSSQRLVP